MTVLKVDSLQKTFYSKSWWFGKKESFTAVKGISFALAHGEILGFLGANGAGKTTTIQMLLGILKPTSGSIIYFDKDFLKYRSQILKKVTFASAYVKLPGKLTIYENLDVFARLYNVPHKERIIRIKKFLTMFNMWEMRNKETGVLSAGQMTRVMLAKAFVPHPSIVLLDEPTASLDPDVALEVRQFVLKEKEQEGLSVLFTSHNMDEVTQVCDRVLVLQNGTIIADNTPWQLATSVANIRVHLLIPQDMQKAILYAQKNNAPYKITENNWIELEIDENAVAQFLTGLVHEKISYSQIYIDQPTLEDYFLSIVKKK
jgi:ABC-2 type transport system ATP-binding protein